jgi:signal peptidase I
VRYGDRILVLKYLYLFQDPSRWDVVVFKAPVEQKKYDFGQNYIKRLIGRPNETIAIVDGDIYAGPRDASVSQLTVQTKPRKVQESLWRVVSDSDYVPRGLPRNDAWEQPWIMRSGQTGWSMTDPATGKPTPRAFEYRNASGTAELMFKETANAGESRGSKFDDWLPYDADVHPAPSFNDWNLVGDLKVQFFYERENGDGPLQVRLSKRGETFIADLSGSGAQLLHEDPSGKIDTLIGNTPAHLSGSGPHKVEFENVDYCVSLYIDGEEIFRTTPAQYHPDLPRLLAEQSRRADRSPAPSAAIRASQQQCRVTHLSLWRDVFYISNPHFNGSPEKPMRLGPDEYFVLGDNSQISGDGRYWIEAIDLPNEHLKVDAGKVPGRFLLGKAFFVYWPAGYRPFDSAPAIAPDFGDMRLIH